MSLSSLVAVGVLCLTYAARSDDPDQEEKANSQEMIRLLREGGEKLAAAAEPEERGAIEALLKNLDELAAKDELDEEGFNQFLRISRELKEYVQPDSPLDEEAERKLSPYRMRLDTLVGFLFIH